MDSESIRLLMSGCRVCPRNCGADRLQRPGVCGADSQIRVSRAALHRWEEPCLSGTRGSGTVFFNGCSLHCVYCQNAAISSPNSLFPGKEITPERLAEIFLELQGQGAHNINLVTPTHYLPHIARALESARSLGLSVPVVYNTSGYEKADSLKWLEGLVDIYLPDFKYMDPSRARQYSNAADYPERAKEALAEMVRQSPAPMLDERGIMQKGVIVRHLLLPGGREDSMAVVRYLYETYGDAIYISLLKQYTPVGLETGYPELNRKIRRREYDRIVDYAISLGVRNAYIQEGGAAQESFIPDFDGQGV